MAESATECTEVTKKNFAFFELIVAILLRALGDLCVRKNELSH
jgi:hypothetical protein